MTVLAIAVKKHRYAMTMNIAGACLTSTLTTSGFFNDDYCGPKLNTTERWQQFHSRVAKILYVGERVRPDVLPTVAYVLRGFNFQRSKTGPN